VYAQRRRALAATSKRSLWETIEEKIRFAAETQLLAADENPVKQPMKP
jgi:hypothetical protein